MYTVVPFFKKVISNENSICKNTLLKIRNVHWEEEESKQVRCFLFGIREKENAVGSKICILNINLGLDLEFRPVFYGLQRSILEYKDIRGGIRNI